MSMCSLSLSPSLPHSVQYPSFSSLYQLQFSRPMCTGESSFCFIPSFSIFPHLTLSLSLSPLSHLHPFPLSFPCLSDTRTFLHFLLKQIWQSTVGDISQNLVPQSTCAVFYFQMWMNYLITQSIKQHTLLTDSQPCKVHSKDQLWDQVTMYKHLHLSVCSRKHQRKSMAWASCTPAGQTEQNLLPHTSSE